MHACDRVGQVMNEVEVGGIHIYMWWDQNIMFVFHMYILYMLLISCQQQKGHVLCHDDLYVGVLQSVLGPEVCRLCSVCY